MIVIPNKLPWLRILFRLPGSIITRIWGRLLVTLLVASLLTWLHLSLGWFQISLTHLPFTFVGLALSIFLGFRNSTAYDRFWEGRKLWGQLVNSSRNLGRYFKNYLPEDREIHCYLIAFVHALRCHLRGDAYETLKPLIAESDYQQMMRWHNRPQYLINCLSDKLQAYQAHTPLNPNLVVLIETKISDLVDIQGGCERIKSTPIPFAYIVLLHRLVAIYCFFLPFGIVSTVNIYTPFVVLIVSYAFLGLDAIGDSIEDPFELEAHDLPLSAISRTIEINLRQQMGEQNLPLPPEPDQNWVLL